MNETNEVRYTVQVKADEALGHNEVTFWLTHAEGLPEEVYARMIPAHLNEPNSDVRRAADDTFSRDEVDALARYFGRPGWRLTSEKFGLTLDENCFEGDCSNQSFAKFWTDEGYDLPFKVAGVCDLRYSAGPTKAARRARLLAQLAELDNE